MELFNRFLTFAERQTADLKARIPTALQTLLALPQEQQARELEAALQLAAPRVALDPKHPSLSDEQLRITIAVKDDGAFRDAFGKVIAALGVTIDRASRPDVVEHHDGGEILFGSDLTGLPLDSLSHIRELHGALEKATERHDAFPVFNHPDLLRFPTPMAPSVEEVRKSIDDMQLYLRGVLSGCLVRAPGSGRYSVSRSSVGAADTESVGGERVIRRRGFTGRHQAMLEPQLAAFEETLAPVQLLALATLFEWTAYRAYAPRLFHHRGMDERRAGLAATAALKLARDYEARFDTAISILAAKARANGGEPPQLVRKQVLREQIAGWTVGDCGQRERRRCIRSGHGARLAPCRSQQAPDQSGDVQRGNSQSIRSLRQAMRSYFRDWSGDMRLPWRAENRRDPVAGHLSRIVNAKVTRSPAGTALVYRAVAWLHPFSSIGLLVAAVHLVRRQT